MSARPVSIRPISYLTVAAVLAGTGLMSDGLVPGVASRVPAHAAAIAWAERDLSLEASGLRLFRDAESGKYYWYMTYEVVNRTGEDRRFAPRVEVFYDEGLVLRQGEGVPSSVVKQLKAFLGDELLEDQFEILGPVLPGKEHAKSGLVVFRVPETTELDRQVLGRPDLEHALEDTEITVFIQGLSKDTKKVADPKTGSVSTLRRTLRLDYLVPGDPIAKGSVEYPVVSTDQSIFR